MIGTVVARRAKGNSRDRARLGIQVTSISGTPVSVSYYEKEQKGKGKRTAGFIGGGAGGGALIGGLAGGGKGALIGGFIGAGAGTAGAAFTGNKDVVIPSESVISFHLTAPVTITVQPKEQQAEQLRLHLRNRFDEVRRLLLLLRSRRFLIARQRRIDD